MLLFVRFVMAIFPFVREMFFPGKTTKEVVKENKLAVALAILLACSAFLNYYMVKRVYEIAMERKSEHAEQPASKASDPVALPASAPASAASAVDDPDKKTQDETRDRLNALFGKNPP